MPLIRIVAAGLLLAGCGASGQSEVLVECVSPDGSLIASVFRQSQGDRPSEQSLRVNVRPAGSELDAGMASFAIQYGYDAVLTWQASDHLQVDYPEHSVVTNREDVVFGSSQTFDPERPLHVSYREQASTHGYFITEQRCIGGKPGS